MLDLNQAAWCFALVLRLCVCLALLSSTGRLAAAELPEPEAPQEGENSALLGAASLGIAAGTLSIGAVAWWSGSGFEPLHFKDTGFFGERTYAGGADKVGHFYVNYFAVRAMRSIYRAAGARQEHALPYASVFIALIANGIELVDGFTPYGFEYGDVVANLTGEAFGILAEVFPAFDDVVGFRWGYVPSPRFIRGPKHNALKAINDYSGQTTYADLKLGGLLTHLGVTPGPARYLLAGVSWGSYAYLPHGQTVPKERRLGVHIGAALDRVVEDLELGTPGEVARLLTKYYAVPFFDVSLVRDLDHDDWFMSFGLGGRLEPGHGE